MTTLIPKFDFKNGGSTPTGAVNRAINEKLAETVSVGDFGATGNGTTDDTATIQAAINASYGKILNFPNGNYLISSALNITAPITLQCAPGSFQGSSIYGSRIFTNTVGINLLNIAYSGASDNHTGGGSITGLLLDGNSKAAIGLNITGANTTKIKFTGLNIYACTSLGMYISGNHSFTFFGCIFNTNGSSTTSTGGVKIDGANCVNFYGCDSEANNGSGVIFAQGYNNQWNGGTIEGNGFHGVYFLNVAQQTIINNVDFEANNQNAASCFDINISTSSNAFLNICNNNFATNALISNKINNNGDVNYFINNRNYDGNCVLWTSTAVGGLFQGPAGTGGVVFDGTGNAPIYPVMNNTYAKGFQYTTPAFPASLVTTSPVTANYRIYLLTTTDITSYVLYDNSGASQTFVGTPAPNTAIDLPFGWKIKIGYTGVTPTWRWAQV